MRSLIWTLAAAAVTGMAGSALADDGNQVLADAIADRIAQSGKIHGYRLDLETTGGVVTLTGDVASREAREDLVDLVQQQPGVLAVRDRLTVRDSAAVPVADLRPASDSTPIATEGAPAAPVVEPQPVMDYQGGIAPFSDAPVVPPYSWPAYTPYNNFASMAYQTQYPSGAWPFIGPPHPYPMIPSGWRRVSLTWKKGYWWMRFHAH